MFHYCLFETNSCAGFARPAVLVIKQNVPDLEPFPDEIRSPIPISAECCFDPSFEQHSHLEDLHLMREIGEGISA